MNEWWIDRDDLCTSYSFIVLKENFIIVFYWNIYLRTHVEI